MKSANSSPASSSSFVVALVVFLVFALTSQSSAHALADHTNVIGRRVLMSFKETPRGSNASFDCSPSGPCVSCAYSEKGEEKYRCSETGYRIPFKCMEIGSPSSDANAKKPQNDRSTLEVSENKTTQPRILLDSSKVEDKLMAYITYRSCIPAINEEKLSVIGFEAIILCLLLLSGSFVYIRKKRTIIAMAGVGAVGRNQNNSRF